MGAKMETRFLRNEISVELRSLPSLCLTCSFSLTSYTVLLQLLQRDNALYECFHSMQYFLIRHEVYNHNFLVLLNYQFLLQHVVLVTFRHKTIISKSKTNFLGLFF